MDHFWVLHGFTWFFYLVLIDLSMVVHAKKPMFCKFCLWEPKVRKSIHVGITINPDIEIATAQRDCFSCHPVKRCNHIHKSIHHTKLHMPALYYTSKPYSAGLVAFFVPYKYLHRWLFLAGKKTPSALELFVAGYGHALLKVLLRWQEI